MHAHEYIRAVADLTDTRRREARRPAQRVRRAFLAFALAVCATAPAWHAAAAAPPRTEARAWTVVDARTGFFIGGEDVRVRLPMASTTKIMTALVVLREVADLREVMTVPASVERIPLGRMGLEPATRYTCEQLLWALLVESANDAAVTLAVNVAGSQEAFVAEMNAHARRLGLADTRFANPHGLDQEGHFSTAHDLALLGRLAMGEPRFARYVRHRTHPFTFAGTEEEVVLRSHNTFLSEHRWADGVKTGETAAARFCLVASGAPAGERIVAALLGDTSLGQRADDAAALIAWAAAQYTTWSSPAPGSIVAATWGPGGARDLPLALVGGEAVADLPAALTPLTTVDPSPRCRLPLAAGTALAFVSWEANGARLGVGVAAGRAGLVASGEGP
jgi:D-alanyl-D-alanine carboxypeptidase